MQWTDSGIVLSARRHGETSAIVHLMTRGHGLHAGLVRGGGGRRARGVLQPGNEVQAVWRARLDEHLGTFTLELARARAARVLDDPLRLAALSSATEIVDTVLPEREPHAAGFDGLIALMDTIEGGPGWPAAYVRWELRLLAELGFGLELSGHRHEPALVSGRTGRAVPAAAPPRPGETLLPFPAFLTWDPASDRLPAPRDILDGLTLTGFFLERAVADSRRTVPARLRLLERFARESTTSGVDTAHESGRH